MSRPPRPGQVARVFLTIGLIGFGGPAAHVALMHREIVERRNWVDEARFLELLGAVSLIPGPTSTELGILLGYEQAGWMGLFVAGACFILPAVALVTGLGWAYVRYGSLPQTGWILAGVTPVVIGIVADALWRMARTAVTSLGWLVLAVSVAVLYVAGANVLLLLFGAAAVAMVASNAHRLRPAAGAGAGLVLPALGGIGGVLRSLAGVGSPAAEGQRPLAELFLVFLKIGAVSFGSGYVLLAFLRPDVVLHLHWLSDRQLVDAVSVGQVTPGPVFSSAAFVGYVVAGVPGAAVATAAIFLPAFVFVPLVRWILPWAKRSPWVGSFLKGATVAALGLMAGVTVQLGRAVIVDAFTAILAVASFLVLRIERPRINPVWPVLVGGLLGLLVRGA